MGSYVAFIGGYQASKSAVELWQTSAQKQHEHDGMVFDVYPYPDGADWTDTGAVAGFEKQFDGAMKKIDAANADKIYIVGHSSGCAIANELNSRLKGDHKNVTLVDLDGFGPNPKQIKGAKVQAWSADGDGGKGHSLNWSADHIMYHALHATQTWSLHFSLVNKAATDTITKKNYKTEGYAGCFANLDFLC